MNKLNILHSADLHLNERNLEQTQPALNQIVELVRQEKPSLFVFAGDMGVKRGSVTPTEVHILKSAFLDIADVCPVVAISGNHDIVNRYDRVDTVTGILTRIDKEGEGRKPIHSNITVRSTLDVVEINLGEAGYIRVVTLPHPSKYNFLASNEKANGDINQIISDKLHSALIGIEANLNNSDPSIPTIVVGHGTIAGGLADNEMLMTTDIDVAIPREWLPTTGVVAYMWGHLHKTQSIGKLTDIPLYYSGAPSPLTFGQERQEPTILRWSITGDKAETELIPLDVAHQLFTIEIGEDSFTNGKPPIDTVRGIIESNNLNGAKVRLRYSIPREKANMLVSADLSRMLYDKGAHEAKVVAEVLEDIDIHLEDISTEMTQEALLEAWAEIDPERNTYLGKMKKIASETDAAIPADEIHKLQGVDYRVTRLVAHNFKPLIDVDVNFSELGQTICISGANHNGKSQIAEAERFALWKVIRRGTSLSDVVRHGTDEAKVSIYFTSQGKNYRVDRIIKLTAKGAAKGDVVFSTETASGEYQSLNEGTASVTQDEIERLVGTYSMYRSTRFGSQSEIDLLCTLLPSEMKDTLQEAINVGAYDLRQQTAKIARDELVRESHEVTYEIEKLEEIVSDESELQDERKTCITDMNNIETEMADLSSRLETLTTQSAKAEQAQTDIDAKLDAKRKIESEMTDGQNIIYRLEKILDNRITIDEGVDRTKKLRKKLEEARQQRDASSKIKMEYSEKTTELHKQLQELKSEIVRTESRVDAIELQKKRKQEDHDASIARMQDELYKAQEAGGLVENVPCAGMDIQAECELLSHAHTAAKKADDIQRQMKETPLTVDISEEDAEHEKLTTALVGTEKDYAKFEKQVEELDAEAEKKLAEFPESQQLESIKADLEDEEKQNWFKIREELLVAEEKISNANEKTVKLKDDLIALEKDITELQTVAADLHDLKDNLRTVKTAQDELQRKRDILSDKMGQLKQRIKDIEVAKEELGKLRQQTEEASELIVAHNLYQRAMGRDGIPFLLLERSLPRFEQYANEFLCVDEGFGNNLRIHIQSRKELQDGSERNEVLIRYVDDRGIHPLGEASGWQKTAAGYALRASLAKVQAMATGAQINHCLYDEGWGVFDADNIMMGRRMIQKFGEEFGQFFYITHVDAMKEIADTTIKVHAVEGGARVEIV